MNTGATTTFGPQERSRPVRGVLGSAIVAGVCVPLALAAGGPAGADAHVPLPDGHGSYTTHDGVAVHVDRTGENATISGSMAASPLSRNATVSAVATVQATAPRGVTITGGRIETGYLVGCQVDLGSAVHANASGDTADQNNNSQPGTGGANQSNGNGGGDDSSSSDQSSGGGSGGGGGNGGGGGGGGGGLSVSSGDSGAGLSSSGITPYADPSMSITLKPGKVGSKLIQVYNFTGTSGTTQYVDHTISVDGCAGYAEARAYTTVVLHDNVMDSTETLWGKPFSLG